MTRGDTGSVLPIVLVLIVVISVVVVALASYASGVLRLGQVAEASADRLATANGAMDNALEDIQRNASDCLLFNQDYSLSDTINGITADITCDWQGGDLNLVDAFAVVMTGAGTGRNGPLLTITNGGNSANAEKIFEGPVYMAAAPSGSTMNFLATLTIKNGDLYYSNGGTCPGTVALPARLTITPSGYTTKCKAEDWSTLFAGRRPPEPNVANSVAFPTRSSVAPAPDALGCRVWQPGRYTSPPNLPNHSYNYFLSGDYFFDNFGTWDTSNAFVLMGYPGSTGPSIDGPASQDTFANNPCRTAWQDADTTGAAVYLGGNSNIRVEQNSTFEVSGRQHGGYNVGIQALEDISASTVRGEERIVTTASGGNKQLSVQGLVWAPYAGFEFDLISNDAVAALTGGAVVGELSAGASANANNFVIRVDSQPKTNVLNLTATAVRDGSTSVKAVVDVRTTGATTSYGVRSRRVIGLTPE